jgi:hypothetical protein
MTRPFLWLAIALVSSPALAWLVYRLAKDLGFLEPPLDRQHELRRTIVLAIYSCLLFIPVLIYGSEKRWPGAWIIFGIVDGLALVFFAGSGIWAARTLWKLRHPEPILPVPEAREPEAEDRALAEAAPHGLEAEEDDSSGRDPDADVRN